MTPEEKAVAIAELRFAGCHPDWIIWFSRPGTEINLQFVHNMFVHNDHYWAESYKVAPKSPKVKDYIEQVRSKQ